MNLGLPSPRHRLILNQYRLRDRVALALATRLSKLQARWAHLLESKRVYDYVLDQQGTLHAEPGATLVEYEDAELGSVRARLRHGSSDFAVFEQCLIHKQYRGLTRLTVGSGADIRTIVDAGANIGLASLYLARLFPKATIVSVEAEKANFEQLRTTIALNNLENVRALHLAIWDTTAELLIGEGTAGREWSYRVGTSSNTVGSQRVRALSMRDLLQECRFEELDMLKMDIEGAERTVFGPDSGPHEWLANCKTLGIEIHDEETSRRIWDLLGKLGFTLFVEGELTIAFRGLRAD